MIYVTGGEKEERRVDAEPVRVYLHENCRCSPKWVVFHAVMVTERYYMREVSAIEPAWLTELAPHFFQRRQLNLKHNN